MRPAYTCVQNKHSCFVVDDHDDDYRKVPPQRGFVVEGAGLVPVLL